jgi:hypothetical protein
VDIAISALPMQVLFAYRDTIHSHHDQGYTRKEKRSTGVNSFDLMQDIRKFPNALNFAAAQGFLVDVHLLSAKYMRQRIMRATV